MRARSVSRAHHALMTSRLGFLVQCLRMQPVRIPRINPYWIKLLGKRSCQLKVLFQLSLKVLLQTHGTIVYESQIERQKPRKYVFGERKFFDFEKPIEKLYTYGQQVDEASGSDKDHESRNIMMIKNMMEEKITDDNPVNEDVNGTIQVTTSVSSEEDNLLNPTVETVDTVEISSDDPGAETSGWSIIWVIIFAIILIVILVLLISVFTFTAKNYLFHCFSRDEGTLFLINFSNF